ncbi:MAG: winged helix-turn-helix domain-containing protein [Vicinamibacterales bacterium]
MTGKSGLDVRFGPFTLDDRARTLRRGAAAMHLSPKAFDLLSLLVQLRPAAVARAEIHQHLWPDTFVSEGNLAVLVAEIRQALGDSARESTFIRTVQRFGYAFSGVVDESAAGAGLRREPAAGWIVWGVRRAALAVGENVLGRDPAADMNIDAVGVSRRHAMIVVAGDQVSLVDLASKNGTFANGARVTGSVRLVGDTEIHLGPVAVRFCTVPDGASTQSTPTWDAARSSGLR